MITIYIICFQTYLPELQKNNPVCAQTGLEVSSDMHTLSLSMLKSSIQDICWMMLLILKHSEVSVMLATSIQQGQTLALFS